jgi:hypothetical protein
LTITLTPVLSDTPLAVEWQRLTAALRRGPVQPAPVIDLERYDSAVVTDAVRAWNRRMVDEHRSAAVFAGLFSQLTAMGAPVDLQGIVLRMAIDELRHGARSGAVVGALGGEARVEMDGEQERVATHAGHGAHVRVLRNIIYACCISETVSVALTAAERDHTDEPFVQDVVAELHADEILHARYGWIVLQWMWAGLGNDDRNAVAAYVPFAVRNYLERLMPTLRGGPAPNEDQRRRLGLTGAPEARAIVRDTIDGTVIPRLREILGPFSPAA